MDFGVFWHFLGVFLEFLLGGFYGFWILRFLAKPISDKIPTHLNLHSAMEGD